MGLGRHHKQHPAAWAPGLLTFLEVTPCCSYHLSRAPGFSIEGDKIPQEVGPPVLNMGTNGMRTRQPWLLPPWAVIPRCPVPCNGRSGPDPHLSLGPRKRLPVAPHPAQTASAPLPKSVPEAESARSASPAGLPRRCSKVIRSESIIENLCVESLAAMSPKSISQAFAQPFCLQLIKRCLATTYNCLLRAAAHPAGLGAPGLTQIPRVGWLGTDKGLPPI